MTMLQSLTDLYKEISMSTPVCVFVHIRFTLAYTSTWLYLFCNLACHLFCKVSVLADSMEQLAALHHLHDDQEPRSVEKEWSLMDIKKKMWNSPKQWTEFSLGRHTWGWTHEETEHCWRRLRGFELCLDGRRTSYVNAPARRY